MAIHYPARQNKSWPVYFVYNLGKTIGKIKHNADSITRSLLGTANTVKGVSKKAASILRTGIPLTGLHGEMVECSEIDPQQRSVESIVYSLKEIVENTTWHYNGKYLSASSAAEDTTSALVLVKSDGKTSADQFGNKKDVIFSIRREIMGIAEVSGLTEALRTTIKRACSHSDDPVVIKLAITLDQLEPVQKERILYRFIERIENDPVFQQMDISGIYDRQSFDSADHKKIEQLIESSVVAFFKDLDLQDWEIQYLQDLAEEVGEPLYELIDFYLAPQTILQKIRRLWRVQRISVKALKLIAKTAELGQPPTQTFSHFTNANETTLNY